MTGNEELYNQLQHWAKTKGESAALIETNTKNSISFQNLLSSVTTLAHYLGKEKKTIVVALPGGIVDATIWLTALSGGHLIVPVSPMLTEYEYHEVIARHAPDLIISDASFEVLPSVQLLKTVDIQRVLHAPNVHEFTPQEGSVYLSTSGSTGNPKGMELSASQVVGTANAIKKTHRLSEHDRGLTPLPFHHVNAPVVSLVTSMLAGSLLIIAPKFSTSNFWSWVEEYDPTWISIVPTIVAMLLQTEKPTFLNSASLRFIRTASAPLPVINLHKFEKKFGIPLIETYGISEAASTITANPVPPGAHKPGSAGLPLLPLRVGELQDGKIHDLPQGQIGEVFIQGDVVITQYKEGRGAEAFIDGWFKTGDMGYLDEDGYLYLTGRKKEIIIRGGENIAPREIEEVLLTYPYVEEAAVVGQPDPIYGEKVVAFIVFQTENKIEKHDSRKIKEFLSTRLSPEKLPSEIHILDALPRGKTGKIDKPSLKRTILATAR